MNRSIIPAGAESGFTGTGKTSRQTSYVVF